jgi:hypothetical protein
MTLYNKEEDQMERSRKKKDVILKTISFETILPALVSLWL